MENRLINKIAKASGSVAKSFLGFGDSMNTQLINSSNYQSGGVAFGNNGWLFDSAGLGGLDVHFSYNGLGDIVKAYEYCPPVYSIINKQAYAFINGKTFITNLKGKAKDKEATSDYATKVRTLLAKPNALQNGKQFEAQAAVYLRLFGYCIILPIKPSGFPNEDATALWIIPPYMCEINFAKQTFYNLKKGFISSIILKYGNEQSNLNPDDVIILRDITPGFETLFLPNSPIKPIQQNISNLTGIYNSKGTLINYRGALGILTPEVNPLSAIPLDPVQKKEIQNDFLQYGIKSNQWKFIISNSSLKWQQMGVAYKDLMLTEWAEDDTMVICDALNYPFKLLANTKSSSMNGTETAQFQKILYQDFIIPFAEMIYEQIAEAFNAEANNVKIEKDYSHVTVIQDDKLAAGRALQYANTGAQIQWLNNVITANEWRKLTELDAIDDGDVYYDDWVKAGKIFGSGSKGGAPETPSTTKSNVIVNNYKRYDPSEPRDQNGMWTDGSGSGSFISASEERRKELNIPPAWTDVKVNPNKEGDLLATGKDSKGRTQYIYSENATMKAAAVKFSRNKELIDKHGYISVQNEANMSNPDKSISEPAHVMFLIDETGIRPGSLKETGAKVKAYGATTLEGRHIVETENGVRLQFVGKKGVNIDLPVNNSRLALMLHQRKALVGDDGRLFSASDSDLRSYTKTLDGGGFKPKDFRTLKGTQTALDLTKGMSRFNNMSEYKKTVMGVAKKVSQVLGNTPSIALKSYINPFVFLHLKPL